MKQIIKNFIEEKNLVEIEYSPKSKITTIEFDFLSTDERIKFFGNSTIIYQFLTIINSRRILNNKILFFKNMNQPPEKANNLFVEIMNLGQQINQQMKNCIFNTNNQLIKIGFTQNYTCDFISSLYLGVKRTYEPDMFKLYPISLYTEKNINELLKEILRDTSEGLR